MVFVFLVNPECKNWDKEIVRVADVDADERPQLLPKHCYRICLSGTNDTDIVATIHSCDVALVGNVNPWGNAANRFWLFNRR